MRDSKKIKIAHVRTSHGVFGAERVILGLLKAADKEKYDVSVILLASEPDLNHDFQNAIQRMGICVKNFLFNGRLDLTGVKKLRKYILHNNIDLIHCHDFKANFYGIMATHGATVKKIATHHSSTKDSLLLRFYLWFNEFLFLRFFHRIIAASTQLTQELWARLLKKKVIFIPNGIDTEFFNEPINNGYDEPDLYISPGKTIMGIIGRLFPDKGHEDLFNALAILKDEFPNLILLVVGDGPEKERLVSLREKLGLRDEITFCGVRREMRKIYKILDLFVMPSIREGLPMALLEAMLARVPVVATRVGEIPSVLDEGKRGRLIDPNNPKELYSEIKHLLYNPTRTENMVNEAEVFVHEKYSAVSMTRNTESLYCDLLGKKSLTH
ncbi:glycosyltransferase family 4 protein [Thermodesulfobacteriota bacterium]